MEEWKEYKLEEVCSRLRSGKGIKSDCISNIGLFPVIGGNGMRGYTNKSNFKGECAVIGRQGANCGNVRFFMGEAYMTEHAVVAVGNELADSYFLARLLSLMHLGNLSAQSAQPGLSIQTLSKQIIRLPSISYQREISTVLKSLDDKIELNRRINDNLEQQAQALFKSWFVDFEPFKGRKFVDSELGMIPEGWRVGTLNELIISTLGGDWGKEDAIGNYVKKVSCIRGADIPEIRQGNRGDMPTRFILNKNFLNKALKAEDLVVEISGGSPTQSTGRICQISDTLLKKYDDVVICTNFCRAIKTKRPYSQFIYYLWEYLYKRGVMFLYENGTTGIKNLDINGLLEKEIIVIPDENTVHKYTGICNLFSQIVQSNGYESERLVKLRDTLLPKLMSGELKINDINN
jgi:type I restriction-modification system specificity subunit